jgi:hypothetical protein
MYSVLNEIWRIARDPENRGREQGWVTAMPETAQPAPVPGIIQQVFPNYHGVAWYWTSFALPPLPQASERVMLRFGAVDYLAEVWVNGEHVGRHEGGEAPFELDATAAVRLGENLLAVRVVNPGNERVDGLVLGEIPHRNKIVPHQPGCTYNYGGILLPVEVAVVPAVRIADVFARPDWKSGTVRMDVTVRNDTGQTVSGRVAAAIGPQGSGETQATATLEGVFLPGSSSHALETGIGRPHLWSVDDPFLYLLAVDLMADSHQHRRIVRIGFRDFRVEEGWFILNGKRLFLKSTHTCNHFPIGQVVPPSADMMRRDLIYAKACGYNCVRFIAGVAWPEQLDCCDEIGLMVYEECLAAWWAGGYEMPSSEDALKRFDFSVRDMILRDRNHPSVTIWGLLNETGDGPLFRRAVASLPWVRELDATRLVLLSSGRWDCQPSIGSVSNPGSAIWEHVWGAEAPGAPAVSSQWNTLAGGYFENAGDAHVYPGVPQTEAAKAFIRNLGRDTKPVFLSEYGIGSLMDIIGETRKFEETGCRTDIHDCAAIRGMAEKLEADWKRWGFDGTYPLVDDMLRDSQRLHMRQRRLCFDLVRANPSLCGYNLTGMLDHGMTGEGLWTYWRELKPLAAETLRDGWSPLRWCLFVNPTHGYTDRPLVLEAVLANEDVLSPGDYPVTFRITGAAGVVWEQAGRVTVPRPQAGERTPWAIPVLKTAVRLDVPPGEYVFAAHLELGGAPAGDRTPFRLSCMAAALPADTRMRVTAWGLDPAARSWLSAAGLKLRRFSDGPARTPEIILVGLPPKSDRTEWVDLVRRIARGGVAVFLQPEAFRCGSDATFWLPLERKGECVRINDWLYHKECVAKRHPIFEDLQAGGILDWDYYDQIVSHDIFAGQDTPEDIACAAFFPCLGVEGYYKAGTMVASYRLGAGLFILNTLNITGLVARHPAADRLLLNLIRHAHARRSSRIAKLPVDFDELVIQDIYPCKHL